MLRYILVLFVMFNCAAFAADAKRENCATKEQCLNDPECLCWCSQMCGWRKKTPGDHPVYIENDKYGKFCYCKQWDYDHYEDNCINHKNIQQPNGAK